MTQIDSIRKKMLDMAKHKVQQKYSEQDIHIIKSVGIAEDLDPIANLLIEQLREWYSIHFPELNEIVKDHEVYLALITELGNKKNFDAKKVEKVVNNPETTEKIVDAAKSSMGAEVSGKDLDEMKALAQNCLRLKEEKETLTKYLEGSMKKEMPNFTEIAGPTIGAKILAKIGSKKRLAFMPASALQVVGAEKALFMHFKKGVKGPKYGYLYQHPLVKSAKMNDKGRIARSIAAKMAIAARKDYFGSNSDAKEMKKSLDERVSTLHGTKKNPEKEMKKRENWAGKEKYEEMEGKFERRDDRNRDRPSFGRRRDDRRTGDRPRFERRDDRGRRGGDGPRFGRRDDRDRRSGDRPRFERGERRDNDRPRFDSGRRDSDRPRFGRVERRDNDKPRFERRDNDRPRFGRDRDDSRRSDSRDNRGSRSDRDRRGRDSNYNKGPYQNKDRGNRSNFKSGKGKPFGKNNPGKGNFGSRR